MFEISSRLFLGADFCLDGDFLAFLVGFAAFLMFGFVVLFSHRIFFNVFAVAILPTMNFYPRSFNLYLLGLAVVLVAAGGCESFSKRDRHVSMLRIHLENHAQLPGASLGKTVTVLRAAPVQVTIDAEPILTESDIVAAELLDTPGGVAVQLHFSESATLTLEQFSSAYAGKHLAIFGQWTEKVADSRWLCAPLINHRIANGTLSFTPDCSEAEARLLVIGLNNMAKKMGQLKSK